MAHSPHRRHTGCPHRKPRQRQHHYQHRDAGRSAREPFAVLPRVGKKRRVRRKGPR